MQQIGLKQNIKVENIMNEIIKLFIDSWNKKEEVINSTQELLEWINELNRKTYVRISECSINDGTMWFYDDYNGEVLNRKRSFFSIKGMRYFVNENFVSEQPIIIQPEIGYLGIICKVIDGTLYFLMQAKIEPGNVNCVQISPTIQATKSNFTRAHGGNLPNYFNYFENSSKYNVVYDQIQSEQSSRFYKKRNRNMIMIVDDEIEVLSNFKWMTLGQIKELMKIDNLVNMDTRTVISGIPFVTASLLENDKKEIKKQFSDKALFNSIFESNIVDILPAIYRKINDYKMFQDIIVTAVPLNQLVDWQIDEYGIICKKQADFMVKFYDIEISGREVAHWMQPLFKAMGNATFGLITAIINEKRMFLVKIKPEIGSFDKIEIGPTIQWETTHSLHEDDEVEKLFRKYVEDKKGLLNNVVLSEEGGRFYHEQNHNIIVQIEKDDIKELPRDYVWVDYGTLNYLIQINNCINIQLRNLISLLNI